MSKHLEYAKRSEADNVQRLREVEMTIRRFRSLRLPLGELQGEERDIRRALSMINPLVWNA